MIAKGWSKKQVEYAFEEARWEMRKVLLETTPKASMANIGTAESYAKKCLAMNIDELKIKNALFSKGWKPEQIESALKKAKISPGNPYF